MDGEEDIWGIRVGQRHLKEVVKAYFHLGWNEIKLYRRIVHAPEHDHPIFG